MTQIEPGILEESIAPRFLGGEDDFLSRLAATYDTRDSPTIPTRGTAVTAFAGISDRHVLSSISYRVAGIDMRQFARVGERLILAGHVAFRYMPGAPDVPFWVLSSLGGDRSDIGDKQPLRGYGDGRFVDRNLFSSSIELRMHVFDLDLFSQHVSFEASPFLDAGRVFHNADESPVNHLHLAGGIGFRAIARPYVVGYVDVGYASEGVAIFTGIKYPF